MSAWISLRRYWVPVLAVRDSRSRSVGLIKLSVSERQIVMETIERLGLLRSQIRRTVDTASSLDLTGLCADLRQRAAAAGSV